MRLHTKISTTTSTISSRHCRSVLILWKIHILGVLFRMGIIIITRSPIRRILTEQTTFTRRRKNKRRPLMSRSCSSMAAVRLFCRLSSRAAHKFRISTIRCLCRPLSPRLWQVHRGEETSSKATRVVIVQKWVNVYKSRWSSTSLTRFRTVKRLVCRC